MSKNFKALFSLKKSEEIYNGINLVATTLVCLAIIVIFSAEDEFDAPLRNLFVYFAAGGYLLMSLYFKVCFPVDVVPKALTFGMTRKQLFIYMRIFDFMEIAVFTIASLLLLENVDSSVILKVATLAFGVFTWLAGVVGNSIIRYGKIAYWIYYIGLLVVCIGIPRLASSFPAVGDFLKNCMANMFNPVYNQATAWSIIIGFVAIGLVINWLTIRKIAVNSKM